MVYRWVGNMDGMELDKLDVDNLTTDAIISEDLTATDDLNVGDDATVGDDLAVGWDLAVTGTSTLTWAVTAKRWVQCSAVAVTAVATTGAAIPAGSSFVSVTSDNADKIVKLPTPVLWNIIYIKEASTVGFEVRPAAETQFINGTECSSGKELAIADGVGIAVFVCTVWGAAGKWVQYYIDDDGSIDAWGTPD